MNLVCPIQIFFSDQFQIIIILFTERNNPFQSHLLLGWSGGAKVSSILRRRGVQLILAYNWARPAILVAGKGRGGMFFIFSVSSLSLVPLSSLFLFFISSTISSIFYPFLWEMTQNDPQWLTCR